MKTRALAILAMMLTCLAATVVYDAAASPFPSAMLAKSEAPLDGMNPPHAVDIAGKVIPESSATQPDKPIILSKDSMDPKWGELKSEAAFDHAKHHDVTHTMDGRTATACVHCHHTEQPMPVTGKPYLKKSERTEVLTASQLETSKQAVNSCRVCHFQPATAATAEFPPKSVKYPREMGMPPSGTLTNDIAYHLRCISCHDIAMKRDPKLKAPQACGDCHVKKA